MKSVRFFVEPISFLVKTMRFYVKSMRFGRNVSVFKVVGMISRNTVLGPGRKF